MERIGTYNNFIELREGCMERIGTGEGNAPCSIIAGTFAEYGKSGLRYKYIRLLIGRKCCINV